ncbi:MAG TPA: HPr family phosphocarrier protein [Thermoanaerobaculia bacterium]|nr:HPr family phosphocarrier protein [Thermoanaerobaculia bacterium]
MIEHEVEIVNRLGLHARAAAKLVHLAGRFRCEVKLIKDGETVDGKSILGLLMLAAAQGERMRLRCNGADEGEAMAALEDLIARRFEEES